MCSEQDFVSLFQIAAVTYLYNTKTYNHVNITSKVILKDIQKRKT